MLWTIPEKTKTMFIFKFHWLESQKNHARNFTGMDESVYEQLNQTCLRSEQKRSDFQHLPVEIQPETVLLFLIHLHSSNLLNMQIVVFSLWVKLAVLICVFI